MEAIQQGQHTKQRVLQETTETIRALAGELKEKEAAVGAQLCQALQKARLQERTVGKCPKCPDGQLVILRSKKSGKRFVGCTNFFEGKCNTALPLPQTGTVKPLVACCKTCSSPTVAIYLRGRRPWKMCLNPNCPAKGERKK